jgi:hypothetical protein
MTMMDPRRVRERRIEMRGMLLLLMPARHMSMLMELARLKWGLQFIPAHAQALLKYLVVFRVQLLHR